MECTQGPAPRKSARQLGRRAKGPDVVFLVVLLHFDRLAVLLQIELERLDVAVEAERAHGPDDVVAVDGLALFLLALVAGFARDERDELAHALLHRLLAVLGDLGRGRQRHLHDARDVGRGQEPVLLSDLVVVVVFLARHGTWALDEWEWGGYIPDCGFETGANIREILRYSFRKKKPKKMWLK